VDFRENCSISAKLRGLGEKPIGKKSRDVYFSSLTYRRFREGWTADAMNRLPAESRKGKLCRRFSVK
jgi:hypothetical protein